MADDGRSLVFLPWTTIEGFLEHVMIHETRSPHDSDWDADESLTAMRFMRQVIENRSHAPKWFGASGHKPGAETEFAVLRAPGQFGAFANAPDFPRLFIKPVDDIFEEANDPKNRYHARSRVQVQNAITAATERFPPAHLLNPRLYYWRTSFANSPAGKSVEAQKHIHLWKRLQNADFYVQNNIEVTQ